MGGETKPCPFTVYPGDQLKITIGYQDRRMHEDWYFRIWGWYLSISGFSPFPPIMEDRNNPLWITEIDYTVPLEPKTNYTFSIIADVALPVGNTTSFNNVYKNQYIVQFNVKPISFSLFPFSFSPYILPKHESFLVLGTYWGGGEYYSKSKQEDDNRSSQKYRKRLERTTFSLTSSCTDAEGNLYVVGKQRASLFTIIQTDTLNCVQDRGSANADAYIAKFSPQGELLWSHYYGSSLSPRRTLFRCPHPQSSHYLSMGRSS